MTYNLGLDTDGRVVAASATDPCGGATSVRMEMPEAFALDDAFEWRIVDGVAVYDPLLEVVEPEPPDLPDLPERVSAVEAATSAHDAELDYIVAKLEEMAGE